MLLVTGLSLEARAASAESFDVAAHYEKAEYRIPMRDGVKLHTVVYSPKDRSQRYPLLLERTIYSAGPYGPGTFRQVQEMAPSPLLLRSGYIFVFQDVRGKYESEGEYDELRPMREDRRSKTVADETTDNYDTIEWLIRNVRGHSGRVGQWGHSNPAWFALMALVDSHPALKAVSPSSPTTDSFIADDYHFNGALYTGALGLGAFRSDRTGDYQHPCAHLWAYEFFLRAGSIEQLHAKCFGDRPMQKLWKDLMEHPDYDGFWQARNLGRNLHGIKVPVLNVMGYFDHSDPYGAVAAYQAIERQNPKNASTMLLGPWTHGAWFEPDVSRIGPMELASNTAAYYQQQMVFPFFEHHLKGRGRWAPAEAVAFETGGNQWHEFDRWPPRGLKPTSLYLQAGGALSFERPQASGGAASDRYLSDPARPVPNSVKVPIEGQYLLEDQRFAYTRADVLSYQTGPLERELTIAGPTRVNLFVATTGTDSDWYVKLIDVYPDDAPQGMGGYQLLLGVQGMRGRYREDLSRPKPMVPGEVTPVSFDIWDLFHTFRKGHRLMVQVSSSLFPLLDRNPQVFTDIYRAQESQYRQATQTIFRSADAPSHLVLGLFGAQAGK